MIDLDTTKGKEILANMEEIVNDGRLGIPVTEAGPELDIMGMDDPAELRRIFVEMGGNPTTKTFQAAEARAAQAAQKRFNSELKSNPYANASQQTAKAFLSVAIFFVQTIFQYAVPAAFLGLLAAEGIAAYNGFISIMDAAPAAIYAGVIMLVSTVAMFLRESLLQNATDQAVAYKPTFRLLWDRVVYFFGGAGLTIKENSDSLDMTKQALRLSVWSIVIFGTLGRIKTNTELVAPNVPWTQALQQIIMNSDLSTFMEYVGSVLLPLAMYVCLHVLVYFIYRSYLLSTGGVDITSNQAFDFLSPPSYDAMLRAEQIVVYRDMIHLYQAQQAKKLASQSTTNGSPQQLPEPSLEVIES